MRSPRPAKRGIKLLVGHKRPSLTYGHYSKGERVELRRFIQKLNYGRERYQETSRRPPKADFVMQDFRSLTYLAGTFLHAVARPRLPGTCSIKPFFLNSTKVSFI